MLLFLHYVVLASYVVYTRKYNYAAYSLQLSYSPCSGYHHLSIETLCSLLLNTSDETIPLNEQLDWSL